MQELTVRLAKIPAQFVLRDSIALRVQIAQLSVMLIITAALALRS